MLPAPSRLSRREDFTLAVRRGRRLGGRGLVVHHYQGDSGDRPLVGFIVGRTVGNAVIRNRVRRRLRHVMAARLSALPAGSRVVVRATPDAADRSFDQLAGTIDELLGRAFAAGSGR